jgi:RHS repeat-associated protein
MEEGGVRSADIGRARGGAGSSFCKKGIWRLGRSSPYRPSREPGARQRRMRARCGFIAFSIAEAGQNSKREMSLSMRPWQEYDANGNGPKRMVYIGGIFEKNLDTGEVTKYYHTVDGSRLAMRKGATLSYFANDHLGSASVVMNSTNGNKVSETRYFPYGNIWTQAISAAPPTDMLFTGQRRYGPKSGIYHYGARFYSADIGRFLQADTIVPDPANPQDLNRYSYVDNNPVRYTDPTGHCLAEDGPRGGKSRCMKIRPKPRPMKPPTAQGTYWRACNSDCQKAFQQDGIPWWAPIPGGSTRSPVAQRAAPLIKAGIIAAGASAANQLSKVDLPNTWFSDDEEEDERRVVIGKLNDLGEPGAIGEGERTLLDRLPNQGNAAANWEQNERVLKEEMDHGIPIRDASVGPCDGRTERREWVSSKGT